MNKSEKLRENTRKLEMYLNNISQTDCCCFGIGNAQCFALVEIGRRPNISVKELAEIVRIDKSGMSRNVDELVKKGLVERNPSETDRRYVVLTLTEKGQEIFHHIEDDMNSKFEKILSAIPTEKREMVIDSLEIYIEALEKEKNNKQSESCVCCSSC